MSEAGPSLQEFIVSLDQRLHQLTAEEIRTALLVHARSLPPGQREPFVGIFTSELSRAEGRPATDPACPVGDDPLLTDIDTFVGRVAAGEYVDGYGWDGELREERWFGDESWVWEMDALFAGAQDAFLSGDLALAREAYGRLLASLQMDTGEAAFSGAWLPEAMLETEVWEAEARYLRAVYETTSPPERARVLAEEWATLWVGSSGPSLTAVRESREHDVPDIEVFLPAWIAQLHALDGERSVVRSLLVEAVEAHGGVDGLAALARDYAPIRPEYYLAWIDALRRDDRRLDAAGAAWEALEALDPYGEKQALIAERRTALVDDPAEVLDACRAAWRAAPSQARLLALHQAARVTDQVESAMSAEIDALAAGRVNAQLQAVLLLLARRAEAAIALLDVPTVPGSGRGPGRVLIPYLLAAGCAGPTRSGWKSTRLATLLGGLDTPDTWDWTSFDRQHHESMAGEPRPLSLLLTDQLNTPGDPVLRTRSLEAALRAIGRTVEAIVSVKDRRQYASVALLIACAAEAITLNGNPEGGTSLVAQWRDHYPRHVAFRRELELAVEKTRLVRPPDPKGHR